jgi:hypothetical protein
MDHVAKLKLVDIDWQPTVGDLQHYHDLAKRCYRSVREMHDLWTLVDTPHAWPAERMLLAQARAQEAAAHVLLFPDEPAASWDEQATASGQDDDPTWNEHANLIGQWCEWRIRIAATDATHMGDEWLRRHLLIEAWHATAAGIGHGLVHAGGQPYPSAHAAAICAARRLWLDFRRRVNEGCGITLHNPDGADEVVQSAEQLAKRWDELIKPWTASDAVPSSLYALLEAERRDMLNAIQPAAAPVAADDADGPVPPNRFRYGGREVELVNRAYEVLACVWQAGGRASYADVARAVWNDHARTDTQNRNGIKKAVERANNGDGNKQCIAELGLNLRSVNGYVVLDLPPAEAGGTRQDATPDADERRRAG